MQPSFPLTHDQIGSHLHALRQEAAQARRGTGRPSPFGRVLRLIGRIVRQGASRPGARHVRRT